MNKEILVGKEFTTDVCDNFFVWGAVGYRLDELENNTFASYITGTRFKVLRITHNKIIFQRVLTNDDEIYDYCIEKLKKIKELEKSLEVIDKKYIVEARKRLGDK